MSEHCGHEPTDEGQVRHVITHRGHTLDLCNDCAESLDWGVLDARVDEHLAVETARASVAAPARAAEQEGPA